MARLSAPPPPLRLTVSAGLLGAFLLARGRPEGLALMESTPAGAWRSFIAAPICLPAYLALLFFFWADLPPKEGLARPLVADLIGYAVGWVAFLLATLPMVEAWGRGAQWPRFVSAWNWISAVQHLLWLVVAVAVALGLPRVVTQFMALASFGYTAWLGWFVIRAALGVGGGRATALVLLDLAIGLFLSGLVQRLSLG